MSQQQIMVVLGADVSDFSKAMAMVQTQMKGTASTIQKHMNDAQKSIESNSNGIAGSFKKLQQQVNGAMSGIKTGIKGGLISMLPSVIPMVSSVGAGAMALGASFTTAGVGIAGFGAVAVSVLGDVFTASEDLAEAQKALDNASTAEERTKALEMQKEALAGLSAEQQKAVTSLQTFKSYWSDFTRSFEKPVVSIFGKSLDVLKGVLDKLKPSISGSMTAISGLVDKLGESLGTPDMERFFTWLGDSAAPAITSLGVTFGNVFRGIANLLVAFSPLSESVQGGLEGMTERFANWTSTLSQSKGFQQFIDYVKANAPVMIEAIGGIIQIIGNIVTTLAPVGATMLSVFSSIVSYVQVNFMPVITGLRDSFIELYSFLSDVGVIDAVKALFQDIGDAVKWIGDNMTTLLPLLAGLGTAFLAFKTLSFINTAIGVFNGLMVAMRAGTLAQTLAQIGLNTAMLASPFTWIAVAIGALIAIGILLWQNWDSISAFLVATWQKIKEVAASVWNGLIAFFTTVWNGIVTVAMAIWESLKAYFTTLFAVYKTIFTTVWNGIKAFLSGLWNGIKAVAVAVFNGIKNYLTTVFNIYKTIILAVWNGIKSFLSTVWNGIKSLATAIFNGLKASLTTAFNAMKNVVQSVWNAVKSVTSSVWNAIRSSLSSVWNAMKSLASSAFNGIKSVITSIFNAIRNTITSIWNGIKSVTSSVWNGIKSSISSVVNGVRSSISNTFNSIRSTASSVWNAVKSAMTKPVESAKNTIKGIIDSIKGFFSGLSLKFPSIKMPKLPSFNMSGKFSLNPPSVPKLGISWHANGGIIKGTQGGTVVGVGENGGDEAIVPLSNKSRMKPFAQAVASMMPSKGSGTGDVTNNFNIASLVVREEADIKKISKELYKLQKNQKFSMGL
jgi:phage-related protein